MQGHFWHQFLTQLFMLSDWLFKNVDLLRKWVKTLAWRAKQSPPCERACKAGSERGGGVTSELAFFLGGGHFLRRHTVYSVLGSLHLTSYSYFTTTLYPFPLDVTLLSKLAQQDDYPCKYWAMSSCRLSTTYLLKAGCTWSVFDTLQKAWMGDDNQRVSRNSMDKIIWWLDS